MNDRLINRMKVIFLVLFGVGVAGVWAYQWFWARPAKACAEAEAWWDNGSRTCARPVFLSDVTGRPVGVKRTPEQIETARTKSGLKREAQVQKEAAAKKD
ncbi:hypothetical protein [Caulobacter sp. 17J65-9]|uniref:hypothetical protein n=1 Tax=Caulobacter sp. 17J65-9 TaxID=2709382 RepID=UPI0013C83E9D|nr:hypothetical protein [Caulobacter sp. 17J65-9]NEX93498.1 hypothetical protein [Caulobacter sp. 17J65-9]